ncbi:unnamed protein product [Arabidopsis halleri]
MSYFLLSKMAKLKINYIRHTISIMQKSTTTMPVISQLLNNRLIGMEFSSVAVVPTMFKREDYKRTKHDALFSKWQILIRPNDWKDFNNGKEGVIRRYRHEDLPPICSTGLYELGVAVIGQDLGQKFDPDNVVPIYLGESVDVRSRLQDYGRCGGHLPASLFEDISLNGFYIFFRYALMGSKWEAAAIEGMILSTIDYACNTRNNGRRRQLELVEKLGDREFMSKRKSQVLVPLLQDQVVTRIKEEKKNKNFLTSILKLMRPFGFPE